MSKLKRLPTLIKHCMTIGELPSSYKVSFTYEEQLLWFCDFLENQVIPVVNNNSQVVQELQNYFNTLDVQEEINNKLDEMAESGELQEIIDSYLQLNALLCFNNVEEMKNATNLINGSFARTCGFHEMNDGGEAIYKIRNITNEDTIDNMLIIQIGEGQLIAELINYGKFVNVKQLGAYGDDTHDDLVPLQKSLDLSETYTPVIPKGTYKITENLVISNKSGITIQAENSKIHYTGTDYAIKVTKTRDSNFKFGTIEALSGGCIKFESLQQGYFNQYINLEFDIMKASTNCIHAYVETAGWNNEFRIKKGRLQAGQLGVLLENNRDAGATSGWFFEEVGFEGVTNGIELRATQGSVTHIVFNYCRNAEMITTGGKWLIAGDNTHDIEINQTVSINSSILNINSNVYNLIFNCPVFYYNIQWNLGGYFKSGAFVANEANSLNLLDGDTSLTSGTDLNDLTYPRTYIVNSTVLNSLLHRPFDSVNHSGKIVIMSTSGSIITPSTPNGRLMQIIFTGNAIYTRRISKSSGTYTYSNWAHLDATEITTVYPT